MPRSWDTPGWDVVSYRKRIEEGSAVNLYRKEGRRQWDKKLIEEFSQITFMFRPDARLTRFSDDFFVSITIGIDVNDKHESPEGNSIPYYQLIATLNFFGFDPLYAIRRDEALNVLGGKANSIFFRINASNNINIGSSKMMFGMSLAKYALEYAKDYIRGKSSLPKPELSPKTIANRRYKQEEHPDFYRGAGGINEAMWESGQLEEAVHIMDVKVIGSLKKRPRSVRSSYGIKSGATAEPTKRQKEEESRVDIFKIEMTNLEGLEDRNAKIMAARDSMYLFQMMVETKRMQYKNLTESARREAMGSWWRKYKSENPGNIEALRSATRFLGIEKLTFDTRI
jgi:hypothetical protein